MVVSIKSILRRYTKVTSYKHQMSFISSSMTLRNDINKKGDKLSNELRT